MRILLLGAPGSGKGTQAKLLSEIFQVRHISSGDLFRNNSNLTNEEKEEMQKGNLLSRERVLELVEKELKSAPGFILDGYPRTLDQAHDLKELLSNGPSLTVIHLKVSDNTVIERLSGRLTCSKCTATFHTKNRPPKTEGICDECGATLEIRSDDQLESIQKRIAVYHKHTEPLIEFYKERGHLKEIDSEGKSYEEVLKSILETIRPQE